MVVGQIGVQWVSGALGVFSIVWFLVLFFSPFFLVPAHFKWQSPPEHSVTLAFVTGVGSWLLAFACIATITLFTKGP